MKICIVSFDMSILFSSLLLLMPGLARLMQISRNRSGTEQLCLVVCASSSFEVRWVACVCCLVPAAWTRQCFCSFAFSSGGWWTSRRRHGRSQTEGSLTRRRRRGWVHSRTRAKERVDSYLLIGRFDDINAASKSEEISTNNTTYRRCESAVFGSSGLLPRREGGLGEGMLEK